MATVTPFLNEALGEGNWQVDTQTPNRVLTAKAPSVQIVKQAVEKACYTAEPLN